MKKKTPIPREDPRGPRYAPMTMPNQGTPLDMEDHPLNTDHPLATQVLGDTFSALGPKAAYSATTNQMNSAVGISSALRGEE